MTIYVITKDGNVNWIYNRRKHCFEKLEVPLSLLRKFTFPAFRLGFKPELGPLQALAEKQELSINLKLFEI